MPGKAGANNRLTIAELAEQIRALNLHLAGIPPATAFLISYRFGVTITPLGRQIGRILCQGYRSGAFDSSPFESLRTPETSWTAQQNNADDMLHRMTLWLNDRGYKVADVDSNEGPLDRFADALLSYVNREEVSDMFPANHFQVKYGLPSNTLNKARRNGRLSAKKRGGRWFYQVSEVRGLWPDVFIDDG